MTDKLTRKQLIEMHREYQAGRIDPPVGAVLHDFKETALGLMKERDEIGAKYDESYSDDDYKVIREAVQTFSIRNTKLEAKLDALAAAEAELREACIARAYIRENYRDERCRLCGAFWKGRPSDKSELVHEFVILVTAKGTERIPCPLATDLNERGKEIAEKARKWDEAGRIGWPRQMEDERNEAQAENARLREAGAMMRMQMVNGIDDNPTTEEQNQFAAGKLWDAALRGEQ